MMMEINLLPHREARRAADLKESIMVLVLGLVVLLGAIFFVDKSVKSGLETAKSEVAQLEADIKRYKPQQELVETFKKKRKQLTDKLDIIESLENARNGPVLVLDELSTSVPERLWLTSIETSGESIELEGQSLDTGVVADFLRGLNASPFFRNVDLDKTSGGEVVQGVRLVNFVIRADMMKASVKTTEAS